MANSAIERVTTSRGGAIAVGVIVAVIAADPADRLRHPLQVERRFDRRSRARARREEPDPEGHAGHRGRDQGQLYQNTSVPEDNVQPGAISDPSALNGRTRGRRYLSGLAAHPQQLLGRGLVGAQRAAHRQGACHHDDDRRGHAAALRMSPAGTSVDIYTQLTREGRTVIQLFRPTSPSSRRPAPRRRGNVVLKVRHRGRRRTSCSRRPRRRSTSSCARPPAPRRPPRTRWPTSRP